MAGLVRPLRTAQEQRAVVTPNDALARGVRTLLIITQPIAAVWWAASRWALSRQRHVRPLWYVAGSSALLAGALLAGTARPYFRWAQDLGQTAQTVLSQGRFSDFWPALGATAVAQWPQWIANQLVLGAAAGVFAGAVSAAIRSRRRADWRADDALAVPERRPRHEAVVQRAVARVASERRSPTGSFGEREVLLGVDELTSEPWSLLTGELAAHCYVDAPSGMGKTTLLVRMMAGLVLDHPGAKVPVVWVNMKPDPAVTARIAAIAHAAGRRFWRVTEDGRDSAAYNPLARGTAFEVANAVIEAEANAAAGGFTEPHYRRAAERYLRLVARALIELHEGAPAQWSRDYPTLARLMYPEQMGLASPQFSAELAHAWSRYARELASDKDLASSIGGLRQRVAGAAESAAEPVLTDVAAGLVLEDAILAGDVVLFDLDAASDKNAAQLLGNLALQDLNRTLARLAGQHWNRDHDGRPTRFAWVPVDEFSALGGTILADLFARSRTNGGSVLLATQEAGSLDQASDTFREVVITNANVLILGQQSMNAEFYAGLMGTESALIETRQVFEDAALLTENAVYASGQGNVREGERYACHPNVLRRLRVGQVVVRVKSRAVARPSVVRVAEWAATTPTHELRTPPPAPPPAAAPHDPPPPDETGGFWGDDHD